MSVLQLNYNLQFFVLHINHKPLNRKTTQSVVKCKCLSDFYPEDRSCPIYLYLFTGQSCPFQYGGDVDV